MAQFGMQGGAVSPLLQALAGGAGVASATMPRAGAPLGAVLTEQYRQTQMGDLLRLQEGHPMIRDHGATGDPLPGLWGQ
jgi:hypothetical protein